jgi:hypothetical protein
MIMLQSKRPVMRAARRRGWYTIVESNRSGTQRHQHGARCWLRVRLGLSERECRRPFTARTVGNDVSKTTSLQVRGLK